MSVAVLFLLTICSAVALWRLAKSVAEIRALKRHNRELERAIKQRALLAREVAHELKNPITAILCSADTLNLMLVDKIEEDLLRCFGYIREYGDSILRLVNDFIDISAGDAGQSRSDAKPTIVQDIVRSVCGLLESSATRKQIAIDCETLTDARALVDPRHLKQIVFNLLHNAIKFTPHNGKIHVTLTLEPKQKWVELTVIDTGIGMSSGELDELFDPYARGRGKRRNSEQGVGLGLPLTYRLVRTAGGEMSVTSIEGEGTKIIVHLPLVETKWSEATAKEALNVSHPLAGQSILIIDPHDGARATLENLIAALGGIVEGVASATEALEAIGDKQFSTLLIDDEIELGSAEELLSELKRDPKHANTRVVVARSGEEANELRGDSEIAKPLNGARLLASLVEGH